MGAELIIPLVASAIAGGTSYYNTQKTAKRQDQTAAEGIRQTSKRQQEADAKVRELVAKIGESNPESQRKSSLDQYMKALGVQAPNAQASFNDVAGSDAYAADVNAARSGVTNYGTQIADLMARIDSPRLQRQDESNLSNRFGLDVDQIGRFAQGDNFLNQLKLNSIRRNPFLDAISTAAQAFGSSYTGGYGGGTPATGSKYPAYGPQ